MKLNEKLLKNGGFMDAVGSSDKNTEDNSDSIRYQLDHLILDPRAMTLVDSTNNQLVSEDEKLIAAMTLLASRYPEVVTKDELMKTLWPGLIVTEWSITRFIADTRKLLGARHHIKTVHGRGYRYNHPVVTLDVGDHPAVHSTRSASRKSGFALYLSLATLLFTVLLVLLVVNRSLSLVADQTPSIAIIPVTIQHENPAWGWGIVAFLSEKMRAQSLATINLHQLQHDLEAWRQHHSGLMPDQSNVAEFCQSSGCTKILYLYQKQNQNQILLRYEWATTDSQYISREFSGANLHQSLAEMWLNLQENLHLDPITSDRIDDSYVVETYVESLGNIVEKDWSAAISLLKLLVDKYPDFVDAKILLATIMLSRHELNTAQTIVDSISLTKLDETSLFKIHLLKTQLLLAQDKPKEALLCAVDAETFAEKTYPHLKALSLVNSGEAKMTADRSSIDDFTKASEIFLKNDDQSAFAKAQLCLAEAHEKESNQLLANDLRQKAIKILRQAGNLSCSLTELLLSY